jgi:hypothetical protein
MDAVSGPLAFVTRWSRIVKLLSRLNPGGVLCTVPGAPPAAKERGVKTIAIRVQPDPNRLAHLAKAAAEKPLLVPLERTFPIEQAAEAAAVNGTCWDDGLVAI